LFWPRPNIDGHGDAAHLASAVHDALALTKTPASAPAGNPNADLGFDAKQLDNILGHAGKKQRWRLSISRSAGRENHGKRNDRAQLNGYSDGSQFPTNWNGKAAITGDFVLTGKEVNPVIKALRQNGISVTALHSHMLDEQPRLFFMHFWANDEATKLAKGL